MISLRIKSDGLQELGRKAAELGQLPEAGDVTGRAVASLVKNHLFSLDSRANRLGGERTHFYSNAAKSVEDPRTAATGSGFTTQFQINAIGLAQRWLGGTITAGSGTSSKTGLATKYLAIPANAEAYGKTPAEFDNLKFFPTPRGGGLKTTRSVATFLRTKKDGKTIVGYKGARKAERDELGDVVMFWLVPSVTQQPDASVMPSEDELGAVAHFALSDYLDRWARLASANGKAPA